MSPKIIRNYIIVAVLSGSVCTGITVSILNAQNKIEAEKKDLITALPPLNSFPAGVSDTDLSRFWKVWNIVHEKYIDKDTINKKQLIEGATQGMVAALDDPYSEFLTKVQNTKVKETYAATFGGVGIELGLNAEKQLIAVAPIKGSPAEKAGVQAGDTIWSIDGKTTVNMSLVEAAGTIRGEKGTRVKLLMQRNKGEPFELDLMRDTIQLKTVDVADLGNGIMYIQMVRFGDNTNKEWDEVVDKIVEKKAKKVIFDLRNNTGGYIETAVHVNSDFLTGLLLQQVDYKGDVTKYNADHEPRLSDVQLVVLVNKGTASSSEIVAGALQDRGFAKLVGEKTFGKGILQQMIDLDEGTGLHITIAKWLLPSGKSIHKVGVTPDYEIKITEQDIKNKRDTQLEKAIDLLK